MRGRNHTAGFTLLEMLLAMALMSILAGSLYASLSTAFKGRRAAARALEAPRRATTAAALVQADIESALPPTGVLAGAFTAVSEEDASGEPADVLSFHALAGRQETTEPPSPIVRIEILPVWDEETAGRVLVRRATVNLLAPETQEPVEEVLCRGLRSFDLAFFDGTDWVESWDSTVLGNVLPPAVEVTLVLAAEDPEDDYTLRRTFALPCAESASETGGGAI